MWRNDEQALSAAGFKKRFACGRDCFDLYFAWLKQSEPTKGFAWAKGDVEMPTGSRYSLTSALSADAGRMLVGTLGKPGQEAPSCSAARWPPTRRPGWSPPMSRSSSRR